MPSLHQRTAALPKEIRERMLAKMGTATVARAIAAWRHMARPEQLAPGTAGAADSREDWGNWLCLAGRGWGKTRTGAEWSIEQAKEIRGGHGALIAGTARDASRTMVSYEHEHQEEASGILAVSPGDFRPRFKPSKNLLLWPNGSTAELFSAEEPERLRGPQYHWAWCDELAAWKRAQEAWDQLQFGLRLGKDPKVCITTTPKPTPLLKAILADPETAVSRGSSYDNRDNISDRYYHRVIRPYEGTRKGRQELWAELLDDIPGALWTLGVIDALRVMEAPDLVRVVIGVDPAATSTETSSETGIIAAGLGVDGHGYVLGDRTGKYSPAGWGREVVGAYNHWAADRVIGEVNNGGDMVEHVVRTVDPAVSYKAVRASRGKQTRAEPVAALYEQGKVHHVGVVEENGHRQGVLLKLEDQMCQWDPTDPRQDSPDRVDALVWAMFELMLGKGGRRQPKGTMTVPLLTGKKPW